MYTFNISNNFSNPKLFMIVALENSQILYILAKDILISVEKSQLLINNFSDCFFEKPKNDVYLEIHLQLLEGKRDAKIFFADSRIFKYKFTKIKNSHYKKYHKSCLYLDIEIKNRGNELIIFSKINTLQENNIPKSFDQLYREMTVAGDNGNYKQAIELRDRINRIYPELYKNKDDS